MWIALGINLIAVFYSLLLLSVRRLPISLRRISVPLLFLILGIGQFLSLGWNISAFLFLLGFTLLCSALWDLKMIWVGYTIGLITLIVWFVVTFLSISTKNILPSLIGEVFVILLSGLFLNLTVLHLRGRVNQHNKLLQAAENQSSQLNDQLSDEKRSAEGARTKLFLISEVSQLAASSADIHLLLKQVANLLLEHLELYFSGVFLVDQSGEYAVLHYGTGEAGRQMLSASYRLSAAGFSLIGKSIKEGQPKSICLDTSNALQFDNLFLPESRSELVIPISCHNKTYGVLDLHSDQPVEFSEETSAFVQRIADILALALEENPALSKPHRSMLEADLFNRSLSSAGTEKPLKEIEFTYQNPSAARLTGETSTVSLPLMLRGEKLGEIEVEVEGKELSIDQSEFLDAIAAQTAVALENASLLDQTLRRAEREKRILEITSKIRSTNDSQKMLQIALEELSQNLDVSKAQIVLHVPESPKKDDGEPDTKSLNRKPTTGELHLT